MRTPTWLTPGIKTRCPTYFFDFLPLLWQYNSMSRLESDSEKISIIDKFISLPRYAKYLSSAAGATISGVISEASPDHSLAPAACSLVAIGYLAVAGKVYIEDNPISPED